MAKQTVQGMVIEQLNRLEEKVDKMIPMVEELKVKTAIVGAVTGGVASIIGTGIMTAIISFWHK